MSQAPLVLPLFKLAHYRNYEAKRTQKIRVSPYLHNGGREAKVRQSRVLNRLPTIHGDPIRLEIRHELVDRRGAVHAGAFIRERRIAFDAELAADPQEFSRIFVHEIFHFVWLRLGNARRWSYEALLREEMRGRARGELGWSAEWRKRALAARAAGRRRPPPPPLARVRLRKLLRHGRLDFFGRPRASRIPPGPPFLRAPPPMVPGVRCDQSNLDIIHIVAIC